jgi:hypothetical protein
MNCPWGRIVGPDDLIPAISADGAAPFGLNSVPNWENTCSPTISHERPMQSFNAILGRQERSHVLPEKHAEVIIEGSRRLRQHRCIIAPQRRTPHRSTVISLVGR